MSEVRAATPDEAFRRAIFSIRRTGLPVSPRGLLCHEQLHFTLHVHRPWALPFFPVGRDLKAPIIRNEVATLIGQTTLDATLPRALVKFTVEPRFTAWGAYGPRVRGQLMNAVETLKRDRDSRQAVVTIYDGRQDLMRDVKDVPCTLSIQFFIRDARLISRVSMRSSDAWLGLPYDLHQFCALHCAMAQWLDVRPGVFTLTAGSFHLYQRDMEKVDVMLTAQKDRILEPDTSNAHERLFRNAETITTFCQSVLLGACREDYGLITPTPFELFMLGGNTRDASYS